MLTPVIMDIKEALANHTYKMTFQTDTIGHSKSERYRLFPIFVTLQARIVEKAQVGRLMRTQS